MQTCLFILLSVHSWSLYWRPCGTVTDMAEMNNLSLPLGTLRKKLGHKTSIQLKWAGMVNGKEVGWNGEW